jgi:hypothetical protein
VIFTRELVGELVSELDNRLGSVVVSCYYEELVAEARDNLEPRGRAMSFIGSSYQATASEDCNRLRRPSVSFSDL